MESSLLPGRLQTFDSMISSLPSPPADLLDKENVMKFAASVTTLGDLLEFGQLFKAFGNN